MCISLSLFQNQYKVGNLYKSLFINPKINICNFELFCPACSQSLSLIVKTGGCLCSLFTQGEGCEITGGGGDKGRVVRRDGQR